MMSGLHSLRALLAQSSSNASARPEHASLGADGSQAHSESRCAGEVPSSPRFERGGAGGLFASSVSIFGLVLALAGCTETGSMVEPPLPPLPTEPTERSADFEGSLFADVELTPLPTPAAAALGADESIRRLESELRFHEERTESSGTWLDASEASSIHRALAQLTGRFEHFREADRWMDRAYELAGESRGPHFEAARLHYSLHRFESVEAALTRVESGVVLTETRRELDTFRADLAFALGEYESAEPALREGYEARLATPEQILSYANYVAETGDYALADALLEEALDSLPPAGYRTALIHLVRGLLDLDYGRFEASEAHYRESLAAYPGWYLTVEHLAEALAEQGQLEEARALYEPVVESTGSPELMGALADTLDALYRPGDAARLREEAEVAFLTRLEDYPEAVGGHGVDLLLALGRAEEALEVAQANVANRPNGEAMVAVIGAAIEAEELEVAQEWADALDASAFRRPGYFEVRADLADALGETDAANTFRAELSSREMAFASSRP